jgi:tRNA(Ile)-lysidine synthase
VSNIASKTIAPAQPEPLWFESPTHEVCIQNNTIALIEKTELSEWRIETLPATTTFVELALCDSKEVHFGSDAEVQFLDATLIHLPLIIRNWQEGDSFKPLGAPGRQKISDFLTHAKIPAWKKKKVQVIETGGQIAAVLGIRISNDFKVSDQSTSCLRISFN